ncbi:NUDIX domain-containing protein [Micromonospora sp. DT44]|uniref:NUDIX domain-containing protein n=1 Tax=Micromonospora sp. DT44 TaxID=3393439 RepID=UPI003CF4A6EC
MSTEPLRCAGALIVDRDGRIFFQRRSPHRRLFPDCWDIVGGHLEPGEEIDEALRREVTEETGWFVSDVLGQVGEYRYVGDDGLARRIAEEGFALLRSIGR